MKKIGTCPICGKDIIEYGKNYSCTGYKETGCRFTIWKTIYSHEITEEEALKLIDGEEIGPFDLITKDGKEFNAKLVFDKKEMRVKPSWKGLSK